MRRLTREELYGLVWASPMTKVAKQFGLSDVALHKICRKHDVPTPPQGYWAKKKFGKPVTVTPLQSGDTGPIYIHERAGASESNAVAAARGRVHTALTEDVEEAATQTSAPFLERSLARLAKTKPGKDGLIRIEGDNLIAMAVRPETAARAQLLLTSLIEAAQRADITLVAAPGGARWLAEGEQVEFALQELTDRQEHVPTEKELRAVARWEAERAAYLKRTGYDNSWGKPHIPKWEERFQGRLGFVLEAVRDRTTHEYGGPTLRSAFNDTKTRDVAKSIPQVVAAIAAIAVTKRENAVADEARRLARATAEQRRRAAERAAARERAQEAGLAVLLSGHAQRRALAEWLADLAARHGDTPLPVRVARLQAWATARLARWDEAAAPPGLEGWLADQNLFAPDDDEPPEPY